MTLKVELLKSRLHLRSSFDCGKESLNNYIKKQASQDLKKRVSTVFVLIDRPDLTVLAYYTLSSYTVEITALDPEIAKKLPRYPLLPATLLGRLAVDKRQQGKKFGELMLLDALKKSLMTSQQVASLAVIVEAIDSQAIEFYLYYGFQQFSVDPMKLYLPMKTISQLFS